jgi:hypothetical protein
MTIPVITLQPIDQYFYITTVESVEVGTEISFTATASGDPTPTIQWQVSTDIGATWIDLYEETSNTCTITVYSSANDHSIDSDGLGYIKYRVIFINSEGSATSNVVNAITYLNFTDLTTISLNIDNQVFVDGQTITFEFDTRANSPPYTIQWQKSLHETVVPVGTINWINIEGETSKTYTFVAHTADNNTVYRALLTSNIGVQNITTFAAIFLQREPETYYIVFLLVIWLRLHINPLLACVLFGVIAFL